MFLFFLFLAGSGFCFAQEQTITLHEGIARSMSYLTRRLPEKTRVVVLNFSAPTRELSDYVIEELSTYIVNDSNLVVVDRRNLELLQEEMDFQMSGEVSDDTAQAIGKKLGAQTIISGSFMSLDELYRMRVRAINVQTAEVQGQQTTTIRLDSILAALLRIKYRDPADFPLGNRIAAGFLNILAGAGSYSMGDWKGGLTLSGGYAAAAGLLLWDIFGFSHDDDLAGIPGRQALASRGSRRFTVSSARLSIKNQQAIRQQGELIFWLCRGIRGSRLWGFSTHTDFNILQKQGDGGDDAAKTETVFVL